MLTNDLFTGSLDRDITREIVINQAADDMPIYSALVGANLIRRSKAEKPEWSTGDVPARRTQIDNGGAAYDETTTALTVDSSAPFYVGCLILCEATGEVMLCTAVGSDTTITVKRGFHSTAAAGSVANNAYLTALGYVSGEGTDAPAARNTGKNFEYNYIETMRQSVELSGLKAGAAELTENSREFERKSKFEIITRDIEHKMVFGARGNTATDAAGKRAPTMGGLINAISTHVDNVGGTMTEARWTQFCEMAFAYGSREKFCFAGNTVLTALHAIYSGRMRLEVMSNAAGVRFDRIRTPYGDLLLRPHRGWKGVYAQRCIVADPNQVKIVIFDADGDLALRTDIHEKKTDAVLDEWFFRGAIQWGEEATHATAYGITGNA